MCKHIPIQLAEVRKTLPESVTLIAVSKTFPGSDIMAAYECGQRAFGENKVQELEQKVAALPKDIEWHLLGHLQSNKTAKALQCAAWIHSVDSVKLLERLERQAGELDRHPNILLEINISGEASKSGVGLTEAESLIQVAVQCRHLRVAGLMTMAPLDADEAELHRVFSSLRKLRDRWQQVYQVILPELSMGMSGDYSVAVAEGATMVRIGTAIFGKRSYML